MYVFVNKRRMLTIKSLSLNSDGYRGFVYLYMDYSSWALFAPTVLSDYGKSVCISRSLLVFCSPERLNLHRETNLLYINKVTLNVFVEHQCNVRTLVCIPATRFHLHQTLNVKRVSPNFYLHGEIYHEYCVKYFMDLASTSEPVAR